MSRTRTRTSYNPSDPLWARESITTYFNGSSIQSNNQWFNSGFKSVIDQTGTITDDSSPRPPLSRAAKRLRVQAPPPYMEDLPKRYFDRAELLKRRSLHPCTHTKTSYSTVEPVDVQTRRDYSYYKYETRSNYRNIRNLMLYEGSPSTIEAAFGSAPINSVDPFVKPDYFDLIDQFNERCDQFIPSNQMLGESMIECDIFVAAFKAVLNPTRAIKSLVEIGQALGKKYRKSSLGTINKIVQSDAELSQMFYLGAGLRQSAKHASSGLLGYSFGIRPAITDLLDLFETHKKVKRRLEFLRSAGGSFVPINVQTKLSSPVSSPTFPSIGSWPNFDSYSRFVTTYEFRGVTARIGAWGRVKENLNWSDNWATYYQAFGLNKAIGLAWELIPYSFVLDWFTNTQEHVNKLTRPSGNGPFTEITGLTSSLKEETVKSLWMIPGISRSTGYSIINPSGPRRLAYQTQSTFTRQTSLPKHQGYEVDLSSLGTFQYVHGAALIIQRVFK